MFLYIIVAAATQHCPSLAVTWTLVIQTCLQSTLHSLHSNPTSSQPWMWVQGPICICYIVWQFGRKQSRRYRSPPDDYQSDHK